MPELRVHLAEQQWGDSCKKELASGCVTGLPQDLPAEDTARQHIYSWAAAPWTLTGSFPSMASIHSLRLASESACSVMVPDLYRVHPGAGRKTKQKLFLIKSKEQFHPGLQGLEAIWILSISPFISFNVKTKPFVYRVSLSPYTGFQCQV